MDSTHSPIEFDDGQSVTAQTLVKSRLQAGKPLSQEISNGNLSSERQWRGETPMDDYSEDLEPDPEMLLQPETRPISQDQLVVEVKCIYAGLVMVEANCIDIDEQQSVAAQEKDPSKRSELKDDQWQSLIALHKQVDT